MESFTFKIEIPDKRKKYKESFCLLLVSHMATGRGFNSFAARIGVSIDTLYQWLNSKSQFADAKKIADSANYAHWERMGYEGMIGKIKNFQPAIWIFNMKNRFGWRDAVEVNNTGVAPIRLYIRDYAEQPKGKVCGPTRNSASIQAERLSKGD